MKYLTLLTLAIASAAHGRNIMNWPTKRQLELPSGLPVPSIPPTMAPPAAAPGATTLATSASAASPSAQPGKGRITLASTSSTDTRC